MGEVLKHQVLLCIDTIEHENEHYYLLIVSKQQIYVISTDQLVRNTNKKHNGNQDHQKYKQQIAEAKSNAIPYLNGDAKSFKTVY